MNLTEDTTVNSSGKSTQALNDYYNNLGLYKTLIVYELKTLFFKHLHNEEPRILSEDFGLSEDIENEIDDRLASIKDQPTDITEFAKIIASSIFDEAKKGKISFEVLKEIDREKREVPDNMSDSVKTTISSDQKLSEIWKSSYEAQAELFIMATHNLYPVNKLYLEGFTYHFTAHNFQDNFIKLCQARSRLLTKEECLTEDEIHLATHCSNLIETYGKQIFQGLGDDQIAQKFFNQILKIAKAENVNKTEFAKFLPFSKSITQAIQDQFAGLLRTKLNAEVPAELRDIISELLVTPKFMAKCNKNINSVDAAKTAQILYDALSPGFVIGLHPLYNIFSTSMLEQISKFVDGLDKQTIQWKGDINQLEESFVKKIQAGATNGAMRGA